MEANSPAHEGGVHLHGEVCQEAHLLSEGCSAERFGEKRVFQGVEAICVRMMMCEREGDRQTDKQTKELQKIERECALRSHTIQHKLLQAALTKNPFRDVFPVLHIRDHPD